MAKDEKQTGLRYEALRERLWNQPRARQFLERLESEEASPAILDAVAQKFAAGQHGEGEFLATIYGDLLRYRNRTAILEQVRELRDTFSRIHQDLVQAIVWIHQLFEWQSYRILEYEDWSGFAEKELGLSEKVAGLLLQIAGQERENTFDALLQRLAKGYVEITHVQDGKPPRIQQTSAQGKKPRAHGGRSS
jgi:hypothetical protein